MKTVKHTHIEPEEENRSIGGHYEVEKEFRLTLDGRELLCVIGRACWDNTCCASGECRYALVPGYLVSYRNRVDDNGRYVSEVIRITDEQEQKKIRDLIRRQGENVQLVDFW